MSKSTRTPKCVCPSCGKVFDTATDATSDDVPLPGDITICLHCGHVMAFKDDLTVRELTSEELHEVATNPDVLAIQKARGEVFKKKH
jgi:C4-type Zn-finger protein